MQNAETMKTTILTLIAAAAALLQTGCEKSEILAPTHQRYIYMSYPENGDGTYHFSFISTDKPTVRLAVPIRFAGRPLDEDLAYAVSAGYDADPEAALIPDTEYTLSEPVFHKGRFADTLFVTVHKTARMDTRTLSLRIVLESNANFLATQTGALEAELRVTAQIARPDWWTQEVVDFYLGTYSDLKFKLFSQEIFLGDYGALDDSTKRYYALLFKYWLEEHPQQEEDGSKMKVAIQG